MNGIELLNPDHKNKRVRRCATCGFFVGLGHVGFCPQCHGPIISLGPIEWTEEDEARAMEDLEEGIEEDPFSEDKLDAMQKEIEHWKGEEKKAGQEIAKLIKKIQERDAKIKKT